MGHVGLAVDVPLTKSGELSRCPKKPAAQRRTFFAPGGTFGKTAPGKNGAVRMIDFS
jgi:hypothetical protein